MRPSQATAPALDGERAEFQIRTNTEYHLRKQVQIALAEVSLASKTQLQSARSRLRKAEEKLRREIRGRQDAEV
jgi:hypothetical protein